MHLNIFAALSCIFPPLKNQQIFGALISDLAHGGDPTGVGHPASMLIDRLEDRGSRISNYPLSVFK